MSSEAIRESIQKATIYLGEHPAEARYTDSSAAATLERGLRIRVEGPSGERISTDMPRSVGGAASAPSPGWLFRAALASCEATLIAMRAAVQGIELNRLEVVVDSESDDRGILGIDAGLPAGPLSIRVRAHIGAAGASTSALRQIAAWGHQHCPVADAASRAIDVSFEVKADQA